MALTRYPPFVQIATCYNEDKVKPEVFALDSDGNVWQHGFLNSRSLEMGWFPLESKRFTE